MFTLLKDQAHPSAEGRSTPRRCTLRVQPRVNYKERNTQFDDINEDHTSPVISRTRLSKTKTFNVQGAEELEPEPKHEASIASKHEKSPEIPESPEHEPETPRHLILPIVIPSSQRTNSLAITCQGARICTGFQNWLLMAKIMPLGWKEPKPPVDGDRK